MVGAQLEDGYTRIANEIMEQLSKTRLNGTQFRIVNAVLRYTYGFNRKQHELSESFLAEATECHKKQVSRELKALIERRILVIVKEATFTTGRIIAFNKYYEEWQGTECITGSGLATTPPNSYFPGSELAGSQGANPLPKKDNLKDNSKDSSSNAHAEVYRAFQKEVGIISGIAKDVLDDLIDHYPKEWLMEALKIAVLEGKRKISYVSGILKNWRTDGYSSEVKPWEAKKQRVSNNRKKSKVANLGGLEKFLEKRGVRVNDGDRICQDDVGSPEDIWEEPG